MLRRRRMPILFPYTTLFRSDPAEEEAEAGIERVWALCDFGLEFVEKRVLPEITKCPDPFEDRKSTRLNSSHVAISYAVFCLKKKTIKQYTTTSLLHNISNYY